MVSGLYVHLRSSWILKLTAMAGSISTILPEFLSIRLYALTDQST